MNKGGYLIFALLLAPCASVHSSPTAFDRRGVHLIPDHEWPRIDLVALEARYNNLMQAISINAPCEQVVPESYELRVPLEYFALKGFKWAQTSLIWTRIAAVKCLLENKRMPIDAIIEFLSLDKLCRDNEQICKDSNMRQYNAAVFNELDKYEPLEILGLKSQPTSGQADLSSRAKLALNHYRLLLHPDKNMDLDEETSRQLARLFVKVQEAYKKLAENKFKTF